MAPQDFRARGNVGAADSFQPAGEALREREAGRVQQLASDIFDDELIMGVEKMVFFKPTTKKKDDPEGYIKVRWQFFYFFFVVVVVGNFFSSLFSSPCANKIFNPLDRSPRAPNPRAKSNRVVVMVV